MSVQRVTYAVFVAAFVAAQVMTVSPFGLIGQIRNMSAQGAMGNSPLAQMLSTWKTQANVAAQPFYNQMMQPLSNIANNFLTMMILGAQLVNNVAKEKLAYLSDMANMPQQQNATGSAPTPPPAPAPQANATNSTG